MDPVFMFVFFGFTKLALIVGFGWIAVSAMKRFEVLEAEKRRAAAEAETLAADAAPTPVVEAPLGEPLRRAA